MPHPARRRQPSARDGSGRGCRPQPPRPGQSLPLGRIRREGLAPAPGPALRKPSRPDEQRGSTRLRRALETIGRATGRGGRKAEADIREHGRIQRANVAAAAAEEHHAVHRLVDQRRAAGPAFAGVCRGRCIDRHGAAAGDARLRADMARLPGASRVTQRDASMSDSSGAGRSARPAYHGVSPCIPPPGSKSTRARPLKRCAAATSAGGRVLRARPGRVQSQA